MAANSSDQAAPSVFKLHGLLKTFNSDIEHLGNRGTYTDTVIHLQYESGSKNSTSINTHSAILAACIKQASSHVDVPSSIAGLLDAVRRREGEPVAELNSLGKVRLEYSLSQDTSLEQDSLEKLLDIRKGLAFLLSSNEAAEVKVHEDNRDDNKDPLMEPDITINLKEEKQIGPRNNDTALQKEAKGGSSSGTSTPRARGGGSTVKSQSRSVASKKDTALPKQVVHKGRVSLTSAAKPAATASASASGRNIQSSEVKDSALSTEDLKTLNTTAKPLSRSAFGAHKVVLAARIPYYTRLLTVRAGGSLYFGDAKSETSVLPKSAVSEFAMECIIQYAYNPENLWKVFVRHEPCLIAYLQYDCKQYRSMEAAAAAANASKANNGKSPSRLAEPPIPITSVRRFVEVAMAADYLGIEELVKWCCERMIDLVHGMGGCQGGFCARLAAKVLQELHNVMEDIGYPGISAVYDMAICFVARWPSKLWRRQLVDCNDEILEDVLEEVGTIVNGDGKDERNRHRKRPSWLSSTEERKGADKEIEDGSEKHSVDSQLASQMKSLNLDSGTRHCFAYYLDILQVQSAVKASATPKAAARWKSNLLQPAIECCLHVLAANFDRKDIVQGIISLAGGASISSTDDAQTQNRTKEEYEETTTSFISFNRSFANTLLSQVTISSTTDWDPPLDKPILTFKTVGPLLKGMTEITKMMPEFQEAAEARQLIVNYLRRNWLSMSLSFSRGPVSLSPFAKWSWEDVENLSKELHIAVDELYGKSKTSNKGPRTDRKSELMAKAEKNASMMRRKLELSMTTGSRRISRDGN